MASSWKRVECRGSEECESARIITKSHNKQKEENIVVMMETWVHIVCSLLEKAPALGVSILSAAPSL